MPAFGLDLDRRHIIAAGATGLTTAALYDFVSNTMGRMPRGNEGLAVMFGIGVAASMVSPVIAQWLVSYA